MLNLYQYHDKPKTLANYERAKTQVPEVVWESCGTDEQLRALEHLWAQNPKLAYVYTLFVRKRAWPEGSEAEKTMARDGRYAYRYARDVLKAPFPAGEPAIARDAIWAPIYARYVLELDDEYAKTWGADYLEQHGSGPHQPNA